MSREHRGNALDVELTAALRTALETGAVTLTVGRVAGHAGYYNPAARSVHLDPDAPADLTRGTLLDALRAMAPGPRLRLIHGDG